MRIALVLTFLLCANAHARNATGYVGGEKVKVKLTEIDGKPKDGVHLGIRSGFRTFEKQAKLYKQYRRGDGNLAAPPGYSNHESGRALDLYVTDHHAYDWLQAHGAKYGFHRTVPGEAWHWEYLGDEDRAIARPAKHHEHRSS